MDKKALIILADGFEEIEAITPIDLLRRAGIKVTLASLKTTLEVKGRNGIIVNAEVNLDSVVDKEFDLVILPGGPGTKELRSAPRVINIVQRQNKKNKPIGAICAAPTVLHEAGILEDHKYTAHFSVEEELTSIERDYSVVEDKNIITSRGAGTATDFSLVLISKILGPETASKVKADICYPYEASVL